VKATAVQYNGGLEAVDSIDDYGYNKGHLRDRMNEISISEFKAKCLGLIDEVQKTRQPLRITRRGKPVAEVIPAGPDHTRKFVGDLVGMGKIIGDIVGHVLDVEDMEAYRD
jgi:prevent-host-death family protein